MTDSLFNVEEFDSESPATEADPAPADGARLPTSPDPSRSQTQSQSLYRKYRPQSFAPNELFGQEHIVNTLKNAIRLDRIGHAYLFCGPRGTGKTTTARILAKAVNCLDPDPANRPCNACDACNAINANATTDVIEIDAASNRGIDDIRELRERVKYAPTMLNTKFYIIDEAHQITGAAANAFLKTLEKPPTHTRFVLATTDPEELLQTIVSRCQRFDFRRIGLDAMTACITMVADAEQIEIELDAVTTIARHATGSLRDALGLLDQVAVYRDEANAETTVVTNELVRTVLGISRNDRVEGLVRAIADQDAGAGLTLVNEAIEAGEDARQLGRQFISYLRMLMLERASGSPDADHTARELARRFDLGRLAGITSIFADVDYKSRHVSVPQLPLELAIIRACLGDEEREPSQGQESRPASKSEPQAQPAASHAQASPAPRKGPSLKDRVRGAAMTSDSATNQQSHAVSEQAQDRFDEDRSAQGPASDPTPEEPVSVPTPAAPSEPGEATPATPQVSPTAAAGGNASLERVFELWDNIRMDVKALNRRTEALLQQADPLQVDGSNLTLVAAYPFHQKRLNDDDTRKTIETVVERHLGTRMTVTCISREEAQQVRPQQTGSTPHAPSQADAKPATRNSAQGKRSSATQPDQQVNDDDDEGEPGPILETTSHHPHVQEISETGASPEKSTGASEHDDARIEAAINIFDAVLVEDDQ